MKPSVMSSTCYVVFSCLVMSASVTATFGMSNALGGGGGYGYMAHYEMTTPKPTLGRMIGDKIDGISTLKSMLLGPLLSLVTGLLNKGGGGMAAPAPPPPPPPPPPTYPPPPPPPAPSAAPTYGSTGGYSNINQVSYMGKSQEVTQPQLSDKYRYDIVSSSSASNQQLPVQNYAINSRSYSNSYDYYKPQPVYSQINDRNADIYVELPNDAAEQIF